MKNNNLLLLLVGALVPSTTLLTILLTGLPSIAYVFPLGGNRDSSRIEGQLDYSGFFAKLDHSDIKRDGFEGEDTLISCESPPAWGGESAESDDSKFEPPIIVKGTKVVVPTANGEGPPPATSPCS